MIKRHGSPNGIFLDNGPELPGRALRNSSQSEFIPLFFVDSGKLVQNTLTERTRPRGPLSDEKAEGVSVELFNQGDAHTLDPRKDHSSSRILLTWACQRQTSPIRSLW